MSEIPTGMVTFLFTDIEGSTQLWEHHPVDMPGTLRQHDHLLRHHMEAHDGFVFKTVGDAFCVTFQVASDGVRAALAAQTALAAEPWGATGPIRVRMALHTGLAEERDRDYFGPTVNRVARLLSTAYGGQTVLSEATCEQARREFPQEIAWQDLGEHRLKDLVRPEHIFQVHAPGLQERFPELKSLDRFAHNLPVQLKSFVGREAELSQIRDVIRRERLLTLTGPGGIGKTRLALQAVAEASEDFPDGVWYVELAALSDGALVVSAVASTLGISEHPGRPLTESVIQYLRDRRIVLILDNCEHVLPACASLAESLLHQCPALHLLTTSREALGIGGEHHWPVPQMQSPDPADLTEAESNEAVRLFVDRARSVRPDFRLSSNNARAVVQICNQLDGIPLAIELAAVRVKALNPAQICSRLDNRFQLLTGGSRTSQQRQRTLEATVAWSYDLLAPDAQTLFDTVSVFRGGWTLEAAEAIAGTDVLDGLSELVDKSMIIAAEVNSQDEDARYRMLTTLRAFGSQRATEGCRKRHAQYYLHLVRDFAAQLTGANQAHALHRLCEELDNIRTAQNFAAEQDPAMLIGFAVSLSAVYEARGLWAEGMERIGQATAALPDGSSEQHAGLAIGLGRLHWRRGDFNAARVWFETALQQTSEVHNPALRTEALIGMANLLSEQDPAGAVQRLQECLSLARPRNDRHYIARALHAMGVMALDSDSRAARDLVEEGLELFRELEDSLGCARALHILGLIALRRQDFRAAERQLQEGLELFRRLGNTLGIARALYMLGQALSQSGDTNRAQPCLDESLILFRALGNRGDIAEVLLTQAALAIDGGKADAAVRSLTEIDPEVTTQEALAANLFYQWSRWFSLCTDWHSRAQALVLAQATGGGAVAPEIADALAEVARVRGDAFVMAIRQDVSDASRSEAIHRFVHCAAAATSPAEV